MACNGCNDGCFDESVQLQSGPQGPAGADGTDGADGADGADGSNGTNGNDGVAVIRANMTPTSTTSDAYATGAIQTDTINGTTIDFATVEDFLRMKFLIIGDSGTVSSTTYDWQVLYGSDIIIDSSSFTLFRLFSDTSYAFNACEVEIDLVMTATDTLIPIIRFVGANGVRTSKFFYEGGQSSGMVYVAPTVSISNPISGDNELKLRVKNGNGTSTVDIVYYELIKYLK